MQIPKKILNEIVGNMEVGFICYLHRDTFEVVAFPDPDQFSDMDLEAWKEDIGKFRKNKKKFIEIEKMGSSEGFRVMEEFVDSLENSSTKIRLLTALEGKKPFANFKFQIDNSGEYRELWFAFKRQKNIEWIQNQINFVAK